MAKPQDDQAEDYQSLSQELTDILNRLGQEELDIDTALVAYERGLVLIKILTTYLDQAENRVVILRAKYGDSST